MKKEEYIVLMAELTKQAQKLHEIISNIDYIKKLLIEKFKIDEEILDDYIDEIK